MCDNYTNYLKLSLDAGCHTCAFAKPTQSPNSSRVSKDFLIDLVVIFDLCCLVHQLRLTTSHVNYRFSDSNLTKMEIENEQNGERVPAKS